jgi:TolA-binding protein
VLALARGGRPQEAIAQADSLLRSSELVPEVAHRARLGRAEALTSLGRHGEAAAEYETAGAASGGGEDFAAAAAVLARLKGGDVEQAAEAARRFLDRFPKSPRAGEVRLAMGEALFRLGQYRPAMAAYEPLARGSDARAAAAASRIAWCLYSLGEKARAARAFEGFCGRFPDHDLAAEARALRARALLESGEAAAAASAYEEALRAGAAAFEEEAILGLARALVAVGEPERARARFEEFESRFAASERFPEALYALAELLDETGDAKGAKARYERLLRDFPKHSLAPYARYGLAWRRLEDGEGSEAARLARDLLQGDPPTDLEAPAIDLLAAASARAGEWKEAIAICRDYRRRHPDTPRGKVLALAEATALARSGEPREAASMLESLASAPDAREIRDRVLYELAFARRDAQDAAGAEEAFRALEKDHGSSPLAAEVPFHRAEIAYAAGDAAGAEKLYARVRAPALLDKARYKLGWARLQQGKNEEAAAAFESVLAESPQSPLVPDALFLLGESLFRAGKFEDARRHLSEFRARHAEHELLPKALFRLGLSCGELGRWDEAIDALDDLARRAPKFENRPEADLWVGRALQAKGSGAQARKVLERVVATGGDLLAARARLEIAASLLEEDGPEAALSEYLKVAILYAHEDEVARALLGAGGCLEGLGDATKAAERYRELVERFPRHPLVPEAKGRIARLEGGTPR